MYKITCTTNGTEYLLYAPNMPDYIITAPFASLGVNRSGVLTFGVPDAHPNRDNILPLVSDITLYEDGVEIWYGRSITNEKDFYKTGKITCEGELGFLLDSIYRPFDYSGTITDFLTALIVNHNAQVETRKEFTLGTVTVVDSNDNIARSSQDALRTLDVLNTRLVAIHGGYLRVRHVGAVRYLDYLADYASTNTQTIEFGKNLVDLTQFMDATKIKTVLIPYGAATEGVRLDVKTVNGGLDYISNAGAVASFGQIWETIVFDDVTVAANLLTKAQEYLSQIIASSITLKLSAVDLALLGVEERIKVGDTVRVKSVPHGIDEDFLATTRTIDILHPENTKMQFGSEKLSYTAQAAQNNQAVGVTVDDVLKVARFGEIIANRITAGILQSVDGSTYFDLDNPRLCAQDDQGAGGIQRISLQAYQLIMEHNETGPGADPDVFIDGARIRYIPDTAQSGSLPYVWDHTGKMLDIEADETDSDVYILAHGYPTYRTRKFSSVGYANEFMGGLKVTGKIRISLPTYANNAAAVSGGLAAGDLYRTNGDPDPVCIVH